MVTERFAHLKGDAVQLYPCRVEGAWQSVLNHRSSRPRAEKIQRSRGMSFRWRRGDPHRDE